MANRRKLSVWDSLGPPHHGVGRGVDADAPVQVQVGDDPGPGAAGRVDAVARERHLVVQVPPAAAGVEGRGGAAGEGRDGDGCGDGVLG